MIVAIDPDQLGLAGAVMGEAKVIVERKYERDLDLLLAEEFTVNPAFATLFRSLTKFAPEVATVAEVWVSKSNNVGESDLIVVYRSANGKRFALLIEDKVDAPLQPGQAERYRLGANQDCAQEKYGDYCVLLCAPQNYISSRSDLQEFDHLISLEQVASLIRTPGDVRADYRASFLESAGTRRVNAWSREDDAATNEFWDTAYKLATDEFPELEMKRLKVTKNSSWITLRPHVDVSMLPGNLAAIESLFVTFFLEAHKTPPAEITLDLDATDDPLHGHQEGRFFHGYYDCYCYLPLYVVCGRHLLAAKLRPANIDGAAGSIEEIARIVAQIRAQWPHTRIILRADSGFARDALMGWCEANAVDYIFGLARNKRLVGTIAAELAAAQEESQETGQPARRFKDFTWLTRKSWSRERRVIAKAEWTQGEANPRFIVTSLTEGDGRHLYEDIYCARGEMENRIKECQIDLFADRTSTHTMAANQLRLWFASMAYVLVEGTRRLALQATDLADATCGTIRRKLFKIGALVTISVRRIKFAMASGCPYKAIFATAHRALCATLDTT